jgi:uncharacterized protein YycO
MFATRPWRSLHTRSVQTFSPGEQIPNPLPGDFILTHGTSWTSRMIRWGEAIRYRGADKPFARWNHAAIFINEQGDIIEALGGGVQQRNISIYKDTEYHVVHLENVIDVNRTHEVEFAQACLHDHYGWLTIVSIALSLLTGSKLGFGVDGQEICSALVARCLERTGEIFPTDPWHIMPADLAKYYNVLPEDPNAPVGTVPPPDVGRQARST